MLLNLPDITVFLLTNHHSVATPYRCMIIARAER